MIKTLLNTTYNKAKSFVNDVKENKPITPIADQVFGPGTAANVKYGVAKGLGKIVGKSPEDMLKPKPSIAARIFGKTAIPSYKKGGKVKKTGLALVHKGEKVVPKDKALRNKMK